MCVYRLYEIVITITLLLGQDSLDIYPFSLLIITLYIRGLVVRSCCQSYKKPEGSPCEYSWLSVWECRSFNV